MMTKSKELWKKTVEFLKIPYIFCLVYGVFLNIGVEMLSRKSLFQMFLYLWKSPLVFFYNSFLIATTLSFVLLFRRRVFGFMAMGVVWLSMGIINSILLVFRTTPFTAVDLLLIPFAWSIKENYFTDFQLILIAICAVFVLIGIFLFWWKAPKKMGKLNRKMDLFYIALLFLLFNVFTYGGTKSGILAENFGNIGQAFLTYGFPYGFRCSLMNTGIDKPRDYSENYMDILLDEVDAPITHHPADVLIEPEKEKEIPNIIYLQLESFFDPYYVKGITYSKDPIPVFRSLKREYTSGFLNVPSVGAGTANTEFEVITGMDLDFFGPGEYPYKTVLTEKTCESIAYNLKEFGFTAHAIHNNEGTFYGRNEVFSKLGFDRFCSIEYMNIKEYTPMGWAKDKILTDEIKKVLNSTSTKDLIYTISVQGHGSYPEEEPNETRAIQIKGFEETGHHNGFEYYINQIHEMDEFLAELLDALNHYSEPVMLILYGDHLPTFDFTDEDLYNGDIYQTEYVIWTNYDKKEQNRDLEAYQLSSYVMELLELHTGILTRYHQMFYKDENYLENLKVLEYDMLYGKQKVYNGVNPYQATKIEMGTYPILVRSVKQEEGGVKIQGMNFNSYSIVYINGEKQETELIDTGKLFVHDVKLKEGDIVTIRQVGKDLQALSETEKYIYHIRNEENP